MSIHDFEQLYKEYEKELKRFIYTIARQDMYIAEDILQNTMISAYKYIYSLKDERKLKSWLFTIAKNESKRYFKNSSIKDTYFLEDSQQDASERYSELADCDFSIEYIADREFIRLLDLLSLNEQTILRLHFQYGLKLSEISKLQNEKYNTIKSIYRRSIAKLKTMIEEENGHSG